MSKPSAIRFKRNGNTIAIVSVPERTLTLADFRRWHLLPSHRKHPCVKCHGSGKIVDPKEQPDPIDGHRTSRRIPCPTCDGSGKMSKEDFQHAFESERKRIEDGYSNFLFKISLFESAVSKLDDDELNTMQRMIIDSSRGLSPYDVKLEVRDIPFVRGETQ